MRWEYGPTIPSTVKESLCEPEIQWFNNYNKILSTYMRSIGDKGIELTCDLEPPKSLFVQVRCLEDYGKLELEDGEVITLKKNSQHYLPRLEIESLVKQGILEQINWMLNYTEPLYSNCCRDVFETKTKRISEEQKANLIFFYKERILVDKFILKWKDSSHPVL